MKALPSKAELWDRVTTIPRVDRFPIDSNFLWQTMEGELLRLPEMQTTHIWNSLKMIWNHRVASPYKIIPYKEYKGIEEWSADHTKWTVLNLYNELMNRSDRTPFMNECLRKMAEYMRSAANEKIKDHQRKTTTALTLKAPPQENV